MSFNFFQVRLPWQSKLYIIFIKKLHVCNQNIVFNIPMKKINFLAQKVHVSEILRHFSQLYPTHSRLVYNPTGIILAIL